MYIVYKSQSTLIYKKKKLSIQNLYTIWLKMKKKIKSDAICIPENELSNCMYRIDFPNLTNEHLYTKQDIDK